MLVRHAKSSWDFYDIKDFDRPLNDRGYKDAPLMARRLIKNKIEIDLFVSSPARRALTTANFFAEAYNQKPENILQIAALYEATVAIFYDEISRLNDEAKTVAIFSHNSGITDFANSLTASRIDNLPTCGIFAVKAPVEKWSQFEAAAKEFWFFDYPKAEK